MDTLFRAILWIVVIVGGLILSGIVLGVSSGQIGVMIIVTFIMGFIILGLHLSLVLYKYVKNKDLLTASQSKEGRF
jgi:flagellar motor component MotA